MTIRDWYIPFVLGLSFLGCGDDTQTGGGGGDGGSGASGAAGGGTIGGSGGMAGAGGGAPITWTTCKIGDLDGECATLSEPLSRTVESGKTVDFHVGRIAAATQPARGQLWLLQGGPGLAGSTLAGVVASMQTVAPDLDLYLPDHRGVGESSPLVCDGFETPLVGSATTPDQTAIKASANACLDALLATWGSLDGFSSVEAAADLGDAIGRTRTGEQPVFLWSVSYGTRWALRYLQQFPDQPTGVVLDSTESESLSFTDFGAQLETAAQQLLALCGDDAFCSGRLGPDPGAFVASLLAKLDGGHCPTSANLQKGDYRLLFTSTMTLPAGLRDALPALLYRVDRCNQADQGAILHLRTLFASSQASLVAPVASGVLNAHVALSELYDASPATFDALVAADAPRAFSNGDAGFYRAVWDVWPRYSASPYRGAYPTSTVPILMLQGSLDPLTPPLHAGLVADALSNATLVLLDGGAHGSLFQSPTSSGGDCGAELLQAFVTDPTATLDTSCAADLVPPTFNNDDLAFLFGTNRLWD
ncbi:MAG: alpha/beta fold hydrolase [Polyangiaceae bacterium]